MNYSFVKSAIVRIAVLTGVLKRLAIATIIAVIANVSYAYDISLYGYYFDIISETEHTAELVRGDTRYYSTDEFIVPDRFQYAGEIYTVIGIGVDALSSCEMKSVDIPNTVTYIGASAFSFCENLESVTIPNSVTSIGNAAFLASAISSVTLSESLTQIGNIAF